MALQILPELLHSLQNLSLHAPGQCLHVLNTPLGSFLALLSHALFITALKIKLKREIWLWANELILLLGALRWRNQGSMRSQDQMEARTR